MKIVDADPDNEEAKKQKIGLCNEVSSDSNGMFKEQMSNERRIAEKQLYGAETKSKSKYDAAFNQEQYSVPEENFQSKNTAQQMPPAVTPPNAAIHKNQNQNGVINPGFSQQGEQKERHHHRYCSIPCDDSIGCVTYIVKVNTNAENRVTMSEYSILLRKLRNEAKKDTVDIALMYINSVKDYDTKYQLDIDYMNLNNIRQNMTVFVDKEDCINNRLVAVLKQNGICCFDTDFSQRKISEYLYKLVLSKSGSKVYDLPECNGFQKLNGRYYFVTKEYCERNNYPVVTEKTFEMNLENSLNSENAEQDFFVLAKNHNSAEQFLLLNMIRIAGLLSNPLYYCEFKFNRVVFINGDSEKISRYLQIYERNFEIIRPYSINVKSEVLEEYFYDEQDNVVMLEERQMDSVYLKKNGVEAVGFLNDMIFEHTNSNYMYYNFITVVFSERLAQLMQSEKSLVLNYADFRLKNEVWRDKFFEPLYYLDRLVVDRVCSNFADFQSCTSQNYNRYIRIATEFGVDGNTFALLMLAYREILRQYRSVGELVSEQQMCSYLDMVMKQSDNTYNGGSIAEEFKSKLNAMLIDGELELVENSSLNNCYGSTGSVPVIFNDSNWLYITLETFRYIASKITLASNPNAVRKALFEEGWLKVSENMTYKATLYDNQYSGKINVTAVRYSILSEQAVKMQRGGIFNYTPCNDDNNIDRILIGTDEKGRGVYWSIGHDDLGNGHMLVNGSSGTGKSTAVNLIIKKLLEKNKNIVYVDFSGSAIPERLEKSGMDKAFQNENIFRINIESVLENHSELEDALNFMVKDKKILLFEKKKHDSDVEDFLMLLYDTVAENSTLSIFLIIDEVHELDYKKGSPLYHIMEKGRGNGISLISIFQGPHETESKKQYSMMNQADIRLIFNLSDQNDARSIAEADGLKPPGKFVDKIRNLKKRHCLVIGRLEDDWNELSNNRFIEVTIPDIRK